ncbi:MAG TPA: sugar ABC transporter substrate-binding protein [Ktedonobacterales bacterium]|nr:sugar ABC transporter substrate-binding protein [Ktedonobacterales bacterium]
MHSAPFVRPKHMPFFVALLAAASLLIILTGCGNNGNNTTNTSAPVNGKGCKKVGILLPETNSSPRWETYDDPLLQQQIKAALPGVSVDSSNANGSSDTQQSQAQADLTKGDCILVVAAHDSSAAASIVALAKQKQVPVIAYDRLIQSNDLNYYVSFNNVTVGELQGQYIVDHYQTYVAAAGNKNIAFIKGADTDNNAHLFAQGGHEKLDPLISSGALVNVYEQFTPNWNPPDGQTEVEAALTKTGNKLAVIYTANDDLGGAAVTAITPHGLAGKVLITGQDATVAGLQRILEGTQAMTVYKPIVKEAQATAQLVAAISNGTDTSSLTNGATTATQGGANIPSVLETPTSVDKTNIASTVIADGFVTKSQICTGLPAGTNSEGIC